jgi:hypothetical protein
MKLRIAAATLLLLAGCGSRNAGEGAGGNGLAAGNQQASAAPAAAATGGSLTIQPGEWEIVMEMGAAEVSGMPAGMHMPHIPPTTVRSCVTPEQVSRANANFLSGSGGRAGIACDYSGVTVAGGRIQGTSTCRRADMEATVTMDGSFTPTSYDVRQQMHTTMRGRTSSSTNHLVGRRIGDCTPGQANAVVGSGSGQNGR